MSRALLSLLILILFLFAAIPALAIDRTFAGSAQIDYHFVTTRKHADVERYAFEGFTLEAAGKIAVDISDKLSANAKICFGCHGFELPMGYLDWRLADELNIRVGRFSPSFGHFNLRHDPANHRLSDKPLPYDMGRMLRFRTWGQGVLPSPFPDNGVEINGTRWFGEKAQLDYAAYAVAGFKGSARSVDLDFKESRQAFYVDNNARPTVGGRLALTYKLGAAADATLGGSVMHGTFDPTNDRTYTILGADLVFRIQRTNLRFEYLVRRQEMDVSNPVIFKYELVDDYFVKHGAYAELEQPITRAMDLIVRVDGMHRSGNVLASETMLERRSTVVRYTLGTTHVLEKSLRLKLSSELWQWTDADAVTSRKLDLGFHVAAVGTF
jgi:hypothetical protein